MYSLKNHLRSTASPHDNRERGLIIEEAGPADYLEDIQEERQRRSSLTHLDHHASFNPLTFGAQETPSTSLSDIIDNLPTAVKSSLGPLMLIRRSVSIRGWASYFYEISTSYSGAEDNDASREERAEHHTLLSTSATTGIEMRQQGAARQSNQGQKRRRPSAQGSRPSTEIVEYVEPPQRMEIDRFCGLQGTSEPSERGCQQLLLLSA